MNTTIPPSLHPILSAKPKETPAVQSQAEIGLIMARPTVKKIVCQVEMARSTAEEIFPTLAFLEGETKAIITEVMRPAKANEPVACIHTASGQKFAVDHYELDGVRL